jgi:dihydroorotase
MVYWCVWEFFIGCLKKGEYSVKLLIKNGHLIDPSQDIDASLDILIEDQKIKITAPHITEEADQVIDASNKIVTPGFIDMHTHLREPGGEISETLETGLKAAIAGGFTTVCPMPNTIPACDTPSKVEYLYQRSRNIELANVLPVGAITQDRAGHQLSSLGELKKAGCHAVSDDGCSVANEFVLEKAMVEAQKLDLLVIEHCEDLKLMNHGVVHQGYWSLRLGLPGISSLSESKIVERNIQIAARTSARLHIAHISTKESVEHVRMGKKNGVRVTAEVTPHHFTLTDEMIKNFDTHTKMNPPLRSQSDVEAMKEGLHDGTIDVIATDHAPHALIYKQRSMQRAAFGIIGLETALPLSMRLIQAGVLNWRTLIKKLSYHPACILNYNRGTLKVGSFADITIVDPHKKWIYTKEIIQSKSVNSPFIDHEFTGKVTHTIISGKVFTI